MVSKHPIKRLLLYIALVLMALHSNGTVTKTISQLHSVLPWPLSDCSRCWSQCCCASQAQVRTRTHPCHEPWKLNHHFFSLSYSESWSQQQLCLPAPPQTCQTCLLPQGIGTCSSPAWNPHPSKAMFKCDFLTLSYLKNCPNTSSLFSTLFSL